MLKSRAEIREFIKTLFASSEIIINGSVASQEDLVALCERVTSGKENIKSQKQYINAKQIEKICVTTI